MEIFIRWGWELLEALINGKETDTQTYRDLDSQARRAESRVEWLLGHAKRVYRSVSLGVDWLTSKTLRSVLGLQQRRSLSMVSETLPCCPPSLSIHTGQRVFECWWQVAGKLWPDLIIFVITWSMGVKPSHILQLMWPLTVLICLNWSLSFISLISRTILVSPLVVYLVFLHEKISGHLSP